MIHLDFTKAETLRKLAELPRYGWAEALVRRVDPLWKASAVDGLYRYKVTLERGYEECPKCGGACCGEYGDLETKTLWVDAADDDAATDAACLEMSEKGESGWDAVSVSPLPPATAEVPDEYLAWFDEPEGSA